jgi:hypothetical protein
MHQDSLISGVFYAQIPDQQSGAIIFEDPRGSLPPFGERLTHSPQTGEMLMFPGWLVHLVTSSMSTQPRISFAFNVPGSWTATTDVNYGFQTDQF